MEVSYRREGNRPWTEQQEAVKRGDPNGASRNHISVIKSLANRPTKASMWFPTGPTDH